MKRNWSLGLVVVRFKIAKTLTQVKTMIWFLSSVTVPQLSYELSRLNTEVNVLLHSLSRVQIMLSATQDPPSRIFNGCTNICQYASDGVCDDGGLGSALSYCDYGSDCFDCGQRPETTFACSNTCVKANDGVCQDVGTNCSDCALSTCSFGTDCLDCAPRQITSYGRNSWDSMWSYSYSYDNNDYS